MGDFPRVDGLRLTVALWCQGQRFQCVMPFVSTTALDVPRSAKELVQFWENHMYTLWQDCLAADAEIVGAQCEPITPGRCVPFRANYQQGQFPGTVGTESYSQNVSMLSAFFNHAQATSGNRIRVGKSFYGPPPEDVCHAQHLDPVFWAGAFSAFIGPQIFDMLGPDTGIVYRRCISDVDDPGDNKLWVADIAERRNTVFTQKRRLTPLV